METLNDPTDTVTLGCTKLNKCFVVPVVVMKEGQIKSRLLVKSGFLVLIDSLSICNTLRSGFDWRTRDTRQEQPLVSANIFQSFEDLKLDLSGGGLAQYAAVFPE